MPVSDTTILRRLEQSAAAQTKRIVVRVVGIDEWAWRKGFNNYGTIIVDLASGGGFASRSLGGHLGGVVEGLS